MGKNWQSCAKLFEFILAHKELFDGRESYADVGLLCFYNDAMRYKGYTYMGLAQMLAEANIPFEVLFARDGQFMRERLTDKELSRFNALVVPSVLGITDRQRRLLSKFVKSGGTAIICDAEALDLDSRQTIIKDGAGKWVVLPGTINSIDGYTDLGAHYFQTWAESDWEVFLSVIKPVLPESRLTVNPMDRNILVTPYVRTNDGALVLHVVNYNYLEDEDRFVEQRNTEIDLRPPEGFPAPRNALIVSPDLREAQSVAVEAVGNHIHVVIPSLLVYDIVEIKRAK